MVESCPSIVCAEASARVMFCANNAAAARPKTSNGGSRSGHHHTRMRTCLRRNPAHCNGLCCCPGVTVEEHDEFCRALRLARSNPGLTGIAPHILQHTCCASLRISSRSRCSCSSAAFDLRSSWPRSSSSASFLANSACRRHVPSAFRLDGSTNSSAALCTQGRPHDQSFRRSDDHLQIPGGRDGWSRHPSSHRTRKMSAHSRNEVCHRLLASTEQTRHEDGAPSMAASMFAHRILLFSSVSPVTIANVLLHPASVHMLGDPGRSLEQTAEDHLRSPAWAPSPARKPSGRHCKAAMWCTCLGAWAALWAASCCTGSCRCLTTPST